MVLDRGLDSGLGFMLSDGTRLSDLIDVERREVSMRTLWDPEIYQLELRRIFTRAWTVVAHESEVPKAGDYVVRQIGEDPVVVVRDDDRSISVVLNVCKHRGAKVCQGECGNVSQLRCAYHGWTFDRQGRFLGAPIATQQMHGDLVPKEELGLRRARVEQFAGMVFATWDDDAPTLDEYLGDIKWYLDMMFDRTDDGIEVLGPPQRFTIRANWKCAAEQHAGDGYHAITLHRSMLELFQTDPEDTTQFGGLNVNFRGHGLRCIDNRTAFYDAHKNLQIDPSMPAMDILRARRPPGGMTAEQVEALPQRFSAAQLRVMADTPPTVGGLFPNMGVFSSAAPLPGSQASSKLVWHAFVPKGPDTFEFYNWYLVERSCPDEERERMTRAATLAFGVSGFIETDDAMMWPQMTQNSRGVMAREETIKYHALLGENRPDDWEGGGNVHEGFSKDDNQWGWWLRWAECMGGTPYEGLSRGE